MAKTGRNDLCPCGSGQKYKRCCEAKERGAAVQNRLLLLLIGGAVLAALLMAIVSFTGERAGAVRIWSPEHGHYHDANGFEIP